MSSPNHCQIFKFSHCQWFGEDNVIDNSSYKGYKCLHKPTRRVYISRDFFLWICFSLCCWFFFAYSFFQSSSCSFTFKSYNFSPNTNFYTFYEWSYAWYWCFLPSSSSSVGATMDSPLPEALVPPTRHGMRTRLQNNIHKSNQYIDGTIRYLTPWRVHSLFIWSSLLVILKQCGTHVGRKP